MTQIGADKTVFHLRLSASSADKAFHQPTGQAIASANPGSAAESSSMCWQQRSRFARGEVGACLETQRNDSRLRSSPRRSACAAYPARAASLVRIYFACIFQEGAMPTAKVFRSGNSQAVRIPREFQFDTDEVDIERRGDEIILRRPVRNLRGAFDALAALSDDVFGEGREDLPPQPRKGL
jgi:antitoxin VapB